MMMTQIVMSHMMNGMDVMCDIGLCARIEYLLHLRLV